METFPAVLVAFYAAVYGGKIIRRKCICRYSLRQRDLAFALANFEKNSNE